MAPRAVRTGRSGSARAISSQKPSSRLALASDTSLSGTAPSLCRNQVLQPCRDNLPMSSNDSFNNSWIANCRKQSG